MKTKNSVLVLLSTYNGDKYLIELLDSVLGQKKIDVHILIRDDGSSDNTKNIINTYKKKYKNITAYFGKNIGYAKSFWNLIKNCNKYDYYAFCDQDDVWLDDKLYNAIELLNKYNKSLPLLYTSNVIPVDENLNRIKYNSFKENRVLNVYESFQKSILPGCTFVFNFAAKELAQKYDGYMESHDWALYCIINAFGKVVFDSNSRVLYRLSMQNTIGQDTFIKSFIKKVKRFFHKSKCTRSRFAEDFIKAYGDDKSICDEIKQLANYKVNVHDKMKILFGRKYKGIIFKICIILNRV